MWENREKETCQKKEEKKFPECQAPVQKVSRAN